MVAEGDDLSSRWALMRDFADEVKSIGYEYRPFSQNSNSFAGEALQRGGFFGPENAFLERFNRQLVFDPASGETQSYYVPGFEKPLTNPINTATPMPFPLGALAPPPVPANSISAPDRPVSFDSRFGNRGPIPADNTESPGWPVLRALQEYKKLATVDSPSGSGALSSARAGRDLPSAEPDLGDRLDYAAFSAQKPDSHPEPQNRRVSSAFPNGTARNANQPVAPTEPGPLLGIFRNEPMSRSPFPSSVWGVPDSSDGFADGNWFTRLAGTPSQTLQSPAQLEDILRRIDSDGMPRSWFAQRQS